MTKGCRLLPLYQTSPIPLHLEVLQTLTSFFCLVLFVLHQLASHQLQLLDPQAMHQPGYQTGRMNLESLVKPCYLLWSRKKHVCWQKFFCWSCIWKQKKLKNLKKESRGNQFVLAAHLVAYQIHDKHQIQNVFRSTAIDQIPASQWIYTCCHELKESSDQGSTGLILLQALCKIAQKMLFTLFALEPDFRTVRIENRSSNQSILQVTKQRAEFPRHKPAHILKTGRLETDRRETLIKSSELQTLEKPK